jgi:hypothetical protein
MTLKIEAASDGQTATPGSSAASRHCPRLILDLDEVTLVDVAVVAWSLRNLPSTSLVS